MYLPFSHCNLIKVYPAGTIVQPGQLCSYGFCGVYGFPDIEAGRSIFFSGMLNQKVAVYKADLLIRYERQIDSLSAAERTATIHTIGRLQRQNDLYPDVRIQHDLQQLQQRLQQMGMRAAPM